MKASTDTNSVVGFDLPSVAFDGPEEKPKGKKGKKGSLNKKNGGFHKLGLSFEVMKGIQKRGYKVPTPIQRKTIPIALSGRDVVAMARTGSGKTACFLIPMFEKLKMHTAKTGVRALILSPTRELALQTLRFIRELGKFTGLRSSVILGGDSMESQFSVIHGNPDIIVATPGRFLHLCVEMELKLNSVEYIVFDEADRLFEMGFGEQMNDIMARLPDTRQTLLFSATLPKILVEFARAGLSDPVLLRLDVESKLPDMLKLAYLAVRPEDKLAALLCLLKQVIGPKEQTAVFAATKHHVEYVSQVLTYAGISNTVIYSNLDPSARKINAAKFATGKAKVLIVTDVAARGLDIPSLDNVINFNFPAKGKLFLHRVGRCARAGRKGVAYSLVATEEYPYLLDLHLFLSHPLKPATANMLVKKEEKGDAEQVEHDGVLGRFPEALLDENKAHVDNILFSHSDLSVVQKVCSNAYKKYLTTRPGASVESVRRLRELDVLDKLCTHPVFSGMSEPILDIVKQDMLAQMKSYRPKGTVFELGRETRAQPFITMKNKRKVHEQKIADHHRKVEDRVSMADEIEKVPRQTNLEGSDSKDLVDVFHTVIDPGKRKRERDEERTAKRARNLKDTENYIPHVAPDQHTEAGLSVNTFIKEANNATLDLTGDSEEMMNMKKRLMRWDKKKKKMVQVNPDKKVAKIQTESGQWIPATYKTGRYKEWQERNKTDADEEEESEEEEEEKQPEKRLVSHPFTHWGRHNLKLEMKRKQLKLRSAEEIVSKRIEHEKKVERSKQQGKGKKKGKKGRK